MGKGSSSSSSTSQSSTTNADQRVAAEGQGVAIGAGAQYSISSVDNFPQQVADFANRLLDFSSGILKGANDLLVKNIASGESAVNQANQIAKEAVSTAQTGTSLNLNNILPTVIVGAVIIAGLMFFRKGK